MAVGTLRKHLKAAVDGGWLGVEVSRSKSHHNIYRCAVPLEVELSEKDEALSLALIAQVGEIDDGVSTMSDTPTRPNGGGVSTMSDTRTVNDPETTLRVSNSPEMACQSTPLRVSENPVRVSNGADGVSPRLTQKSSLKSLEVLKHPLREGAVASDSTSVGVKLKNLKDSETEQRATEESVRKAAEKAIEDKKKAAEERVNRIKMAAKVFADYTDSDLAKVARVTLAEVQQLRRQA
jgi:hypothetical protein